MTFLDWVIMILPMIGVLGIALYSSRYMRSVADFMAGGRAAGRYLLCTSRAEQGAGAVMLVGLFEVFYRSGFTTTWWQQITVPVGLVISISGFVFYRYRQTRAMTLAQFFEMRYSRSFRVFTGILGFWAGLMNFGIIPCIGARFFVNFLGLPQVLTAWNIPTYLVLMAIFLSMSVLLTIGGGQVAILVSNSLEGMFSQIAYVVVAVALILAFGWDAMHQVLLDRPPGYSMVNPFDSFATSDFNIWWVLMGVFLNNIYGTMAWQNNHAFNASGATPHDTQMGNILSNWANFGRLTMITLMGLAAITFLHHSHFEIQASEVATRLSMIADPQVAAQMRMPVALSLLLPLGIKGLVCAILLMGVISGDGIHLHSWSSIFVQDVLLPLRKKPLLLKAHLWMLRGGIIGVAIFAFCFGALFKQTEYVLMWFQVTTAIFVGGAGSAIIGGLYWRRGTSAGAWFGMVTGSVLCLGGIVTRQLYPAFPCNGTQISFFAALISIAAYITVSLLTCRTPHNMDQLLHRGAYAIESEKDAAMISSAPLLSPRKILGIDNSFTRGDRIVTYGIFCWSLSWFFVVLIGSAIYLLHPFSNETWASYWRITAIWIPLTIAFITAVWFTIGCISDLRKLFHRLRHNALDIHDDGSVPRPVSSMPSDSIPTKAS